MHLFQKPNNTACPASATNGMIANVQIAVFRPKKVHMISGQHSGLTLLVEMFTCFNACVPVRSYAF